MLYCVNIFRVAPSIHNFVYHLCASWNFHGSGSRSLPSGVVLTNTLFKWNVAVSAFSSVLTSMENSPSLALCSWLSGESPQRTMT